MKKIMGLFGRDNNPRIKADFDSGLKHGIIDTDAMEFMFAEAEKKIAATREAIDSLNEKAKTYIAFSGVGIASLFGFIGFAIDKDQPEIQQIFMAPTIACCLCFLAALGMGFRALGLSDVASLGNEPKDLMTDGYIKAGNTSTQKHGILFRTTEFYQTLIDHNKSVISRKANCLMWTYAAIWTGVAAGAATFLIRIFA
jgi:hypothetical protein